MKKNNITRETRLFFGKHNGKTLEEISEKDIQYFQYLIDHVENGWLKKVTNFIQKEFKKELRDYQNYLNHRGYELQETLLPEDLNVPSY